MRLEDFVSITVPNLILDSLRLLQILSNDFDASLCLATDSELMNIIINFVLDDMIALDGLKSHANEVLLTLSGFPVGEWTLFNCVCQYK